MEVRPKVTKMDLTEVSFALSIGKLYCFAGFMDATEGITPGK
jgi:hypothetical protein